LREAALDFADFMREHGMVSKIYTSTTRAQVVLYQKEAICNIQVYAEEDWKKVGRQKDGNPQNFSITLRLHRYEVYKDRIADEKLDNLP